jgi:hypothetical protein
MALEIRVGPGMESLRQEVIEAVQSALGGRMEAGNWLLTLDRRPGGCLVDLTNRNGVMRQWFFEPGDPIGQIIKETL